MIAQSNSNCGKLEERSKIHIKGVLQNPGFFALKVNRDHVKAHILGFNLLLFQINDSRGPELFLFPPGHGLLRKPETL